MKRGVKRMSKLERELADRFREEVRAKRPILKLEGFRTPGLVDPHHVLRQQTIKWELLGSEPEEVWAAQWDPDNGIPVENGYHPLLTVGMRRLDVSQLRPENIDFARRYGWEHLLGREVPSFSALRMESGK